MRRPRIRLAKWPWVVAAAAVVALIASVYLLQPNPELKIAKISGLSGSLQWTGNRTMQLYRCPADRTHVRSVAGVELGMKRTPSYSMNANLGVPQADQPVVFRAGAIREPARLFVFLDEHENFIDDAGFTVNPAPVDTWSNIPADRHSYGFDLSFADGHVEYWR